LQVLKARNIAPGFAGEFRICSGRFDVTPW
jgi:hypothetical protein